MRKLLITLLITGCTRTIVQPVTPCKVVKLPPAPELSFVDDCPEYATCLGNGSVGQLAQWLRRVKAWHEAVGQCPYVTQVTE